MLAMYVDDTLKDWDTWLPLVLMAYQTAEQSSTGESPYRLLFGRTPRTAVDTHFAVPPPPPQLATEFYQRLQAEHIKVRELIDDQLVASQHHQGERYNDKGNTREYQTGDLVWCYDPAVRRGTSSKLSSPWRRPFKARDRRGCADYAIVPIQGGRVRTVHHNPLKPCYRGNLERSSSRSQYNDIPPSDGTSNIGSIVPVPQTTEPSTLYPAAMCTVPTPAVHYEDTPTRDPTTTTRVGVEALKTSK